MILLKPKRNDWPSEIEWIKLLNLSASNNAFTFKQLTEVSLLVACYCSPPICYDFALDRFCSDFTLNPIEHHFSFSCYCDLIILIVAKFALQVIYISGMVRLSKLLMQVTSQRLSIGMTPKTLRLPKPGEMILSVRGSPLGVYKELNMEAINGMLLKKIIIFSAL